MIAGHVAATSLLGMESAAMLIQDRMSHIPLSQFLAQGDIVLLLTPVVLPVEDGPSADPFEPLGRALARYHPWVRHVPYTAQGGISSTHAGFIKRAKVVVFVISGPPSQGQPSQVELSNIVRAIGDQRPHVVITCCDVQKLVDSASLLLFPTVIQLPGYSSPDHQKAAVDLLFLGQAPVPPQAHVPVFSSPRGGPKPALETRRWAVTEWNQARDLPAIHALWCQCMPPQFKLSRSGLLRVLQRDGYAKHFVVRGSAPDEILGFCATYITYLDSKGDALVGSVAALCVKESHRRQGIGSILHDQGLRGFRKTRGVSRLQLGSTFPRLLYGLPVDNPMQDWFRRRGWRMDDDDGDNDDDDDGTGPGAGQEVNDWLLSFSDWPTGGFQSSSGLAFRACGLGEIDRVLEIVEQVESERGGGNMAWYDQYAKLADSMAIRDIMLAVRGESIVGTAITYVMQSDNPSAEDIPWAGAISDDTGGVTCICITDTHNRDLIMVRLLDACVQALRQQGKQSMYMDAVKGSEAGFQAIGFQRWATYKEIWRNA